MIKDSPDAQTQFQLKEKLYLDAIDFLDKGKVLDLLIRKWCGIAPGCVFGKCKEFQTSQYLDQYRKLSLINCPQAQQSVTKNTSDYKLPGYKVPSKCIEMNSIYYDVLKLETYFDEHRYSLFRSTFPMVVTRMDTLKSGWTPYVYYTTLHYIYANL